MTGSQNYRQQVWLLKGRAECNQRLLPQVPHLRTPSPSEISETFGAGREVRINLVVPSNVRDINQL